jgi:phage shock protein C
MRDEPQVTHHSSLITHHSSLEVKLPLYRSRRHSIIAGVCGGLAEWLGWSPMWVRLLYIVLSILSVAFPGIIVYIILWIVMPKAPY